MPSKGKKFLTEFLLPNLFSEKFGSKLKWVDEEKTKFQLQWSHKAGADWKETDAVVFTEWDKMKGHYRPKDKEYFTKSKQRFRAVLYKLINEKLISEVPSNDKGTKIYHISCREDYGVNSMFTFFSSNSFESHLGSITSDHSYSLHDPITLDNENIAFYPIENNLLSKDLAYQRQEESMTETCNLFNPLEILNITEQWIAYNGSYYPLSEFDTCCETA